MPGIEEYVLKKAIDKGFDRSSAYFSSVIDDNSSKFSSEEAKYVKRAIDLLIESQALYRLHIKEPETPRVEMFKKSIEPIASEAMELSVVGEVKSHDIGLSERELGNEIDDILESTYLRVDWLASGLAKVPECDSGSEIEEIYENQIEIEESVLGYLLESTEQNE